MSSTWIAETLTPSSQSTQLPWKLWLLAMRKLLRQIKYCARQEGQYILAERMSSRWQSGQKLLFLSQSAMHCGWYVCLQNNSAFDASYRQMLQVLSLLLILPFPLPFLHHLSSAALVVRYCCSFSH